MIEEKKITCPVCNKDEEEFWIKKYGMCFWCNHKKQEKEALERLKKRVAEEGESSNEDYIICPYCSCENSSDELNHTTDTYCDECGKEFHLEVEYSASYSTSKIEGKNE